MSELVWRDDAELFSIVRAELYTAVIGDIMDQIGSQHQFLPPTIRPMRDDMFVVGRAMTVLEADVFTLPTGDLSAPLMERPFGLMLEALDDLKSDEIYLCGGASPNYALWGELMSTRAKKLGAAGAVVNGYHRDTNGILELEFPTFSYGPWAQDQAPRGRVIGWRVPVQIGQVLVGDGDIVVGDVDGVCVIPKAIETQVFAAAIEKARTEKLVKKAIAGGMSAVESWRRHGVM